jgi:predicted phage terminase large subunit-like protein
MNESASSPQPSDLKSVLQAALTDRQYRTVRASLTEWCRLCGFEPAAHHRLLIAALEKVAAGIIPRLAVFMPPGSAKSTYTSVLFVAWLMQQQENVLAASHTTELAEKWGRRIRNLIAEYKTVLGVELAQDNLAAHRWATTKGAEYYAAGVGTGIAGFRGKYGIIDDPVRSRQDADSELIRDRTWDWYLNDFVPRLVPGSRQILIQTRWHEDDLAGRALQHDDWHVISLPAIAEENDPLGRKPGEPLWADDAYGYGAQLLDIRGKTPPRTWSALYQQRPAPEEGDYFKAEWLAEYQTLPMRREMKFYGGSDYAVTADGGDYTVHGVLGLDPDGNMYLPALWRGQTASDVWVEAFCDLVEEWHPEGWAEETGQIKAGVGPFLVRRMIERQAYVYREQFPTKYDKAVRAQSIRGRMAMRRLYVPKGAPWVPALRSELLSFPAGAHDDQVDMLGLIGQLLDRMQAGKRWQPEKPKPIGKPGQVYLPGPPEPASAVRIKV